VLLQLSLLFLREGVIGRGTVTGKLFVNINLCCLDTAACIAGVSKSLEQVEVVWKQYYSYKNSRVKKEKAGG